MSSSKAMFSAFQGIRKYTERTSRTETNHKLENSIAAKSPHRKSKNREREKERPPGAVRKRVQKANRNRTGSHSENATQSQYINQHALPIAYTLATPPISGSTIMSWRMAPEGTPKLALFRLHALCNVYVAATIPMLCGRCYITNNRCGHHHHQRLQIRVKSESIQSPQTAVRRTAACLVTE